MCGHVHSRELGRACSASVRKRALSGQISKAGSIGELLRLSTTHRASPQHGVPSAALGSDGAEAAAWRLMEGPPLDYGPATHDDAAQVLAGADGSTEAATSRAGRAAAPPGTA